MNNFGDRLLARLFDYGLCYLIGILLSLILPAEIIDEGTYLLFALFVPLVWAPVEALLIHIWGTTPGKRLFGMKITSHDGTKLSWSASLRHAFFCYKRPGVIQIRHLSRWRFLITVALAIACGSSLFMGKKISDVAIEYQQHAITGPWREYLSEEGGFVVQFPKKPELATHSFPIPNTSHSLNMTEYTAASEVIYSVSHLELPSKWRIFSDGTLLKSAMNVVLEHMGNVELIGKKRITHRNFQALDFHVKQEGSEVFGRLIIVGSTLYKLTVTYPAHLEQDKQHEAFLNSFDLKH